MFGLGFSEILMILVVAIIFLGPDKLPEAAISIAKFLKSLKNTISDAKESLESDLKIDELKRDALAYKQKLEESAGEITQSAAVHDSREVKDLFSDLTSAFDETDEALHADAPKREIVQFPKKEVPVLQETAEAPKEQTHA